MIDIKNLNFKYKETLPYVLKDLNLSIKPGERIPGCCRGHVCKIWDRRLV